MKRSSWFIAVAAIGLVAGWLLFDQQGQHAAQASGDIIGAAYESSNSKPSRNRLAADRLAAEGKTEPRTVRTAQGIAPRRITAERRLEIINALAAAHAVKVEPRDDPSDDEQEERPAPPPTRLTTKKYIQERMDEIQPMIAECYRTAKASDPTLGSRVPVAFTIEGEPEVGGLVTEATLHPSLAKHTGLNECVRETLYALEIDPPEAGGDVSVVYPFDFEESEEK